MITVLLGHKVDRVGPCLTWVLAAAPQLHLLLRAHTHKVLTTEAVTILLTKVKIALEETAITLQGLRGPESYLIACDSTTTTPQELQAGRVGVKISCKFAHDLDSHHARYVFEAISKDRFGIEHDATRAQVPSPELGLRDGDRCRVRTDDSGVSLLHQAWVQDGRQLLTVNRLEATNEGLRVTARSTSGVLFTGAMDDFELTGPRHIPGDM